jgi:hypothetical protein
MSVILITASACNIIVRHPAQVQILYKKKLNAVHTSFWAPHRREKVLQGWSDAEAKVSAKRHSREKLDEWRKKKADAWLRDMRQELRA